MAYNYEWPYVDTSRLNADWLLHEMKRVIKEWAGMKKDFSDLQSAFNDLRQYVEDYFSELNLTGTVREVLQQMLADGSLDEVFRPLIRARDVFIWLQDYLAHGDTPDQAFEHAINDCPAKGTIIVPRNRHLNITRPINVYKNICISGLSYGMFALQGGNDRWPSSNYNTYDIVATGTISAVFILASRFACVKDLSIYLWTHAQDAKGIFLDPPAGDVLEMNVNQLVENVTIYEQPNGLNSYGIYAEKPTLLFTAKNVQVVNFNHGFYFNASINTSIMLHKCSASSVVSGSRGFEIFSAQYCLLECCSVEAALKNHFVFSKTQLTMVNCWSEQCTGTVVALDTCVASINGLFKTTGRFLDASFSRIEMSGCDSSIESSPDAPAIIANACGLRYSGKNIYVKKDGQTAISTGYYGIIGANYPASVLSASGGTINVAVVNNMNGVYEMYIDITASSTAPVITFAGHYCLLPTYVAVTGDVTAHVIANTITLENAVSGSRYRFNIRAAYDN